MRLGNHCDKYLQPARLSFNTTKTRFFREQNIYSCNWLQIFVAVVLLCCLSSIGNICAADELRIIDSYGLTRAVRKLSDSEIVDVVVRVQNVESNQKIDLSLVNEDSIATRLEAVALGDDKYRFSGLRSGNWKIVSQSGKIGIKKVQIAEGQ